MARRQTNTENFGSLARRKDYSLEKVYWLSEKRQCRQLL